MIYSLTMNGNRYRISFMSIQSFKCEKTKEFFTTGKHRDFATFKKQAEKKLGYLDAAVTLDFLRSPPGNNLEALAGDRAGQHSIRINLQWRVCFVWTPAGPLDVEIVDYH